MDLFIAVASADCLCNAEDSAVIDNTHLLLKLICRQLAVLICYKAVNMLLKRTKCLHKTTLEVITDCHNFSCCLHLCCQLS